MKKLLIKILFSPLGSSQKWQALDLVYGLVEIEGIEKVFPLLIKIATLRKVEMSSAFFNGFLLRTADDPSDVEAPFEKHPCQYFQVFLALSRSAPITDPVVEERMLRCLRYRLEKNSRWENGGGDDESEYYPLTNVVRIGTDACLAEVGTQIEFELGMGVFEPDSARVLGMLYLRDPKRWGRLVRQTAMDGSDTLAKQWESQFSSHSTLTLRKDGLTALGLFFDRNPDDYESFLIPPQKAPGNSVAFEWCRLFFFSLSQSLNSRRE